MKHGYHNTHYMETIFKETQTTTMLTAGDEGETDACTYRHTPTLRITEQDCF
jgi:hypothetical protein